MTLCVLTGDIVGSTELTDAEHVRVLSLLSIAHKHLANSGLSFFDQFRGDGWQMAFPDARLALRCALFVRATLRSDNEAFETRIALAEGKENVDWHYPNTATFISSGRALDAMATGSLFVHASGGAWHAATVLADHISRDWTQSQARAVRPMLCPYNNTTQKKVAASLGISRQAVGQALDAAGYPAIKAALAAIEEQAK